MTDQPTESSLPPDREAALIKSALLQALGAALTTRENRTATGVPFNVKSAVGDGESLPSSFPGYEIVRKIHGGGQGVVFLAIQKSTGQKVALKVMHHGPFADPRNRSRLDRCVHILGELIHPGIVRIIDSGELAGSLYYAMDYIEGHSLTEWLDARRPSSTFPGRRRSFFRQSGISSSRRQGLELDAILRLFIKICDAVNAAHIKGVIHRDLKPGNIRIDQNDEPHLLDFDLAKIVIGEIDPEGRFAEMTQAGEFLGSLRWASPEQVRRIPAGIDMRTDVYSLGFMLFEALTGQTPYPTLGTRRDLEDHILCMDAPRPSALRRQIDSDLDTIVLKCLAKSPERRYQSAGAVAEDLRSLLTGAPISARRDNTWYLVTKLMRRHALATTMSFATMATLMSAASISYFYYRNAVKSAEARTAMAEETMRHARHAEETGQASQLAVARLTVGWFLFEWRQGDLQRAKEILDGTPSASPERLAMQFLLDSTYSEERFLAEVPASSYAMAYYIVGERYLLMNKSERAVVAFRNCADLPDSAADKWYKAEARARLAALATSRSAAGT